MNAFTMILMIGLLLLNGAISWWNAYACGRNWIEARMLGGWPWVMVCCGAIQSAIGFSMVYGTVELGALYLVGYLPPETVKLAMDFWYVMIVIPALGSGLLITIHSWTLVFRERRLSSLGGAAWNTYAQAQNTFDAINGIGPVWKEISGAFKGKGHNDEKGKAMAAMVAFLLAAIAILLGILTTTMLIKRYAASRSLELRVAPGPATGYR